MEAFLPIATKEGGTQKLEENRRDWPPHPYRVKALDGTLVDMCATKRQSVGFPAYPLRCACYPQYRLIRSLLVMRNASSSLRRLSRRGQKEEETDDNRPFTDGEGL